ncbi:MAG: paraquat-inducible protein A [Myxococcota bacterium]
MKTAATCARCGSHLFRSPYTLQHTIAYVLAALVLFVPANVLPVLEVHKFGLHSKSTIWDGCVALFKDGLWEIATLVFLASIVIPAFKLMALLGLALTATRSHHAKRQTSFYKVIHFIGPWSMLDVFLVAILVALVKLGEVVSVVPGLGISAFAAVVVLTTLASSIFDPRLFWREHEERDDRD